MSFPLLCFHPLLLGLPFLLGMQRLASKVAIFFSLMMLSFYSGNCQFLCVEEMGFCCKFARHQRACCAWFSDSCEFVSCNALCKCYRQCFCLEIICGCPLEKAFVDSGITFGQIPAPAGQGSAADTRPLAACCCELASCYLAFPGCCSSYTKATCCCLETESSCCKPWCCSSQKYKKSLLCTVQQLNLLCITPSTFCKGWTQCFCLDSRCAIPCDQDVPCICMPLPCITVCVNFSPKCGFCATLQELLEVRTQNV